MDSERMEEKVDIHAAIEEVWDLLIHPHQWWAGTSLEPELEGNFKEIWIDGGKENVTLGKVLSFDAPKKLQLSWKDLDWEDYTKVTFSLYSFEQGVTTLTLIHEDWEIFPLEERKYLVEAHRTGWRYHLEEIKSVAEKSF